MDLNASYLKFVEHISENVLDKVLAVCIFGNSKRGVINEKI